MDILLHLLALACYLLLGVHFWRSSRGATPSSSLWIEQLACLVPLALHAAVLQQALFSSGVLRFGWGAAASLTLWIAAVVYWLEHWQNRLAMLQMMVLPSAGIASLLPLASPGSPIAYAQPGLFTAHFLVAMLAYALATMAALHALLMAYVEKRLHERRFSRVLEGVPPLLAMESLLFRLIAVSFALLTLTLISGVVFSEELFGRALRLDHKTIFALASWVIFGVLLAGRQWRGWRGRTALHWTLAGFLSLLLAYVGTHFVLETLLGRSA
ncbi:MAG: hypothetical protein RIR70_384 [Pseudomonadota bacterium]|jgi:ABC-type uncharacterized transport system permease subunit